MKKANPQSNAWSIKHASVYEVFCCMIFLSTEKKLGYVDTWMMDDASLLHLVV